MARPVGPRLSVTPLDSLLTSLDIDLTVFDRKMSNGMRDARSRGFVTLAIADAICCKVLRLHPHEVWGQEYEDAVWFDMDDDEEIEEDAKVAGFPAPAPNPEPVFLAVAA